MFQGLLLPPSSGDKTRDWDYPLIADQTEYVLWPEDGGRAAPETSWLHFNTLNDGFSPENNNIECNTPSIKPFRFIFLSKFCRVHLKMTVFWDVAPCRLVEVYRRFRGAYCFHHRGNHRPDDGGCKNLRNVGKFIPDNTAQQPRRQSSLFSPP
jgi:hypothetical protein